MSFTMHMIESHFDLQTTRYDKISVIKKLYYKTRLATVQQAQSDIGQNGDFSKNGSLA